MGFLSQYDGVTRIDLDGGYWVDLKNTLTADDLAVAERVLVQVTPATQNGVMREEMQARTDPVGYLREQVVASIVDWNVDGPPLAADGTIWPLQPLSAKRKAVGLLPGPVYERLAEAVRTANAKRTKDEARQFPDGSIGSDSQRADEESSDSEVLVGAAVPPADGDSGGPATPG